MYRIVRKEALKPTVILYEIEAPMVAKKAEPGQFIILRVDENGERIPITIHDYDREKGTVTIIVQTIGATTEKLSHKAEGEYIQDFVGPLGRPTETEGKKKVCVVGGGVGCAIAYPVLKKFHDCGAEVHAVVGFKNKDVVILEDKFKSASDVMKLVTDDGSYGEKGLVTDALKQLIEEGNQYDEIFAIGPAIMMKFVSKTTEPYGIPTTVSMSPIMVDGTGMCGGCRVSVGGKVIGLIRVYSSEEREFTADEDSFMMAVAAISAVAIENARLHDALRNNYELMAKHAYSVYED